MLRIFVLLLISISISACFTTGSTSQQYSLYRKNLKNYPTDKETSVRILHQNNRSYLAVHTEHKDYDVRLSAYTNFEAQSNLFDKTYRVRGNAKDSVQWLELPTDQPLFALEVQLFAPDSQSELLFSDAIWGNRLQDSEQSIYAVSSTGSPFIRKYVKKGESFQLAYRNDSVSYFSINYFKDSPTPAPSPSSKDYPLFNPLRGFDYRLRVPANKTIQMNEEGLYFIQSDSTSNKGAFILCVDSDFPKMTRLNDLILSMRYITKNAEYEIMQRAEDKKKALDEYWLGRSSDKEKSRQQLKLYFTRIATANRLFTAQTEGWKTDKGMIYIVFGVPDAVRKYSNKEIWVYNATGSRPAVEWLFNRTGEQYVLERYEDAKEPWGIEVQAWRNGQGG